MTAFEKNARLLYALTMTAPLRLLCKDAALLRAASLCSAPAKG